ncbi:BTAD domain-containing putative transcriptional regulator [Streptomyces sp. enrichment culture]|uniref:AfsR/SARP family transcriptional regulator n=1 Tax=Streptomyces sp. enrichment culture TaxID=1795815 RepID=UPI003F55B746
MRFRVLGPVSLAPRTPSAAKPRALLATLLTQAGEVVPAPALIDELWGTEPPRTATTTLQVYVSQLRKVLGEGGSDERAGALLTRAPGYLLEVPEQEFDLPRFERLRTQGRTTLQERDYVHASWLLHEALALWTGPALSGIPHGVRLESAAIRLDELRMDVLEQRILADLRLGRHQELAGELLALANEHPLRESVHGHLMVALYRTGRGSDALRVYGRLRHSLVEELGVEPGPALARLHERVLRRDPALDWRPDREGGGSAGRAPHGPPSPRGDRAVESGAPADSEGRVHAVPGPPPPVLPAAAPGFVGRHGELAHGDGVLRAGSERAPVLAVSGPAGVGKTAFALHLAHRVAGLFPDGQVFVSLRGPHGSPLTAAQAGAALLRRLVDEVPGSWLTDPEEVTDRLRRALRGRRLLIVLDDAVSEEQIRPLLPPGDGSAVIVTGRRGLPALDAGEHIALDTVRPDEAVELLMTAGGERMARDPVTAGEIARLCGYFPLALRVAAAALTARPHTTAAALAERLRDERTRLGVLREGDLDLRSSLLTGFQEAGAEQQRAFRLLSLAPGPEFAGWTAAVLLGTGPVAGRESAEELVRAHLLEARTDGPVPRYRFHSLLRVLAAELRAGEPDGERTRRDAVERLGGAYLALARYADQQLVPGREWGERGDRGERGEWRERSASALTEGDAAAVVGTSPLRWFREEITGLVETVRQAHTAELWSLVWQLAGSAAGYFHVCAAWEDWEETHRLALDAALRAGDVAALATVRYSLGDLAWQRRDADRAMAYYTAAQHAFGLTGDRIGAARCRIGAADILLGRGRPGAAARHYGRALALCSAGGDLRGGVAALNGLALVNLQLGREETAAAQLAQCRGSAERLGDRRWTEYLRRTAVRLGTPTPHAVEVQPGIWLIAPAPHSAPA